MLKFLGVVFVVGVASGAFGLMLGNASGWAWETLHRRWRGRHAIPEEAARPAPVATPVAKLPLPPLRFVRNVGVGEYLALAARVGAEAREERGTATALERSITIGAWDGDRLIGVARVLSDGYLTAALADLAVDPDYQKRGLGRELMKRAYDATPRGTLNIVAPRGSGSFFDHIGCERALAGFTLRRTPD